MEHTFNLGSAIQPQPFIPKNDPDAPMYASVGGVAERLSDEEVIFQRRESTESRVMTLQVLELLAQSRTFRSLDAHVSSALRRIPGLKSAEQARQALQALHRAELLIDDAQWRDSVASVSETQRANLPFGGFCIRACDRPDQVERLLASLREYEARFAAGCEVRVFDDSRNRDAIAANRNLVQAYARDTGVSTSYMPPDAPSRLGEWLSRAMPQHQSTIETMLRQPATASYGRNLNAILLHTAGRKLVLLDEDFVFPLARHPAGEAGFDPSPSTRSSTNFFASADDALRAGIEPDADPVADQLRLLGGTLAEVLGRPEYSLDRAKLRDQPLDQLAFLRADARIVSTMVGCRGASRSSSNAWLYDLGTESRGEFSESREAYLRNIDATNLWHGYTQARCTRRAAFTPFGLDNSILTPCTISTGRNEDTLFNTLLAFCHPTALTLQLPQSIGHVQESVRARSESAVPTVASFLAEQLDSVDDRIRANDAVVRIHLAAAILENLAASSDATLASQLRAYLNFHRADRIERLQRQLTENPKAPVYWLTDVRGLIESTARAMVANQPPRLREWPQDSDTSTCCKLLRHAARDMAASLRAWPDLWQYARDHHDEIAKVL